MYLLHHLPTPHLDQSRLSLASQGTDITPNTAYLGPRRILEHRASDQLPSHSIGEAKKLMFYVVRLARSPD
jgi:hypothetical protein